MSSTTVQNFLTKKLFVEKDIVTYRSLSRELAIHVNVAKNELAAYHANASNPVSATYLLTGEVTAPRNDAEMDATMQLDDVVDGEYVPQAKILLVGEDDLAGAISQFTRVQTKHVYSLSPSPIRDAGLLRGPTDIVRQIDNSKKGAELGAIVGKVIGAHVQMKAGVTVAPPTAPKANPPVVMKQPLTEKDRTSDQDKPKENTKGKAKVHSIVEKAKPTGKLDFFRAKIKDAKKEGTSEQTSSVAESSVSGSKTRQETQKKLPKDEPQGGTKRKSEGRMIISDSDDASSVAQSKPPSKTKTGPRVRKGVVLTDEEDLPRASRRKRTLVSATASEAESDIEPSLRAMMDVDDDQVTRATQQPPGIQETEEQEEEESDQDIDTDPVPTIKRKPRKKKIIPVGSNGLRKRRIVKSRQTTDDKGYFVTEDYSSYESVEEEEPEPAPTKGKKKGKGGHAGMKEKGDIPLDEAIPTKSKTKLARESSGASNKPTGRGSKSKTLKPEQKSLANFFGPPKKQQ